MFTQCLLSIYSVFTQCLLSRAGCGSAAHQYLASLCEQCGCPCHLQPPLAQPPTASQGATRTRPRRKSHAHAGRLGSTPPSSPITRQVHRPSRAWELPARTCGDQVADSSPETLLACSHDRHTARTNAMWARVTHDHPGHTSHIAAPHAYRPHSVTEAAGWCIRHRDKRATRNLRRQANCGAAFRPRTDRKPVPSESPHKYRIRGGGGDATLRTHRISKVFNLADTASCH